MILTHRRTHRKLYQYNNSCKCLMLKCNRFSFRLLCHTKMTPKQWMATQRRADTCCQQQTNSNLFHILIYYFISSNSVYLLKFSWLLIQMALPIRSRLCDCPISRFPYHKLSMEWKISHEWFALNQFGILFIHASSNDITASS